jgi:hypothetical protein
MILLSLCLSFTDGLLAINIKSIQISTVMEQFARHIARNACGRVDAGRTKFFCVLTMFGCYPLVIILKPVFSEQQGLDGGSVGEGPPKTREQCRIKVS